MTLSSIVGEVALPALGAGMDMPAHGRRAAMSKRPDGATPRPVPHADVRAGSRAESGAAPR